MLHKQWKYYHEVLRLLSCTNCMSLKQFEECVRNDSTPFLQCLIDYGYKYGQLNKTRTS